MLVTVLFNWWYVETRHCCSFVVYAMHLIWVFTKDIGFVHGVSFPLYLLGSCPSFHDSMYHYGIVLITLCAELSFLDVLLSPAIPVLR